MIIVPNSSIIHTDIYILDTQNNSCQPGTYNISVRLTTDFLALIRTGLK